MGAQKIAHSTEEKDLGVVINQTLSPSHHIATYVSRANRIVGLIKRTYEHVKEEHHRFIQEPGQTTLRILRTSVATTQPKGHRQPGRSSEENDQDDQWNRRR